MICFQSRVFSSQKLRDSLISHYRSQFVQQFFAICSEHLDTLNETLRHERSYNVIERISQESNIKRDESIGPVHGQAVAFHNDPFSETEIGIISHLVGDIGDDIELVDPSFHLILQVDFKEIEMVVEELIEICDLAAEKVAHAIEQYGSAHEIFPDVGEDIHSVVFLEMGPMVFGPHAFLEIQVVLDRFDRVVLFVVFVVHHAADEIVEEVSVESTRFVYGAEVLIDNWFQFYEEAFLGFSQLQLAAVDGVEAGRLCFVTLADGGLEKVVYCVLQLVQAFRFVFLMEVTVEIVLQHSIAGIQRDDMAIDVKDKDCFVNDTAFVFV